MIPTINMQQKTLFYLIWRISILHIIFQIILLRSTQECNVYYQQTLFNQIDSWIAIQIARDRQTVRQKAMYIISQHYLTRLQSNKKIALFFFCSQLGSFVKYHILSFLSIIFRLFSGRRGIATTRNCTHLLKHVLYLFVCIKYTFFLTIFLSLSDLFPQWI